ncbi:hypothetical protein [Limnohabitans sp.]|uniref:hypothetical protein n=1 Tax=Limnohabitans sp. TaxID=1907725 RepID=UPI00286EF768|nr:hypothetical protein [Limnohabitans sp.]
MMKISEGQAEVIKLAVTLAVGAFVLYYAKNAVSGAVSSAKQGVSDSIDSVLAMPGKAVDYVSNGASSLFNSAKEFVFGTPPATHAAATSYNLPYDPGTGNDW